MGMNPDRSTGSLEITKEDHDLLIAGLRSLPMKGTIESLPRGMEKIMTLMKKIQGVFAPDEEPGE